MRRRDWDVVREAGKTAKRRDAARRGAKVPERRRERKAYVFLIIP